MKRSFPIVILAVLSSQALAAAPAGVLVRTSAKPVDPLVRCFAAAEDRAAAVWWFVPRESGGGTFSNMGATGVAHPYFLDVADRGATREIRLQSTGADSAAKMRILAAVDRCA